LSGAFVEQFERETEDVAGTLEEARAGAMKVRKELVMQSVRYVSENFFLY
jgi:hypothetical protein